MGLLTYLLSKPDNWTVSAAYLQKVTVGTAKPTGRDGVYSIIKELISTGFVVKKRSGRTDVDYFVFDEPQEISQPSNTDKTDTSNPETIGTDTPKTDTSNTFTSKPTLINTDLLINTEDLTNKKYNKKDFDNDYLERAYLTFWQAGLVQTNTVKAEKLFHQLWRELDRDPLEFARLLRDDIEKRLNLGQYGFDKLHPTTYLKDKRWLDEYVVFREGRKVSVTPLQLKIDTLTEQVCAFQAKRSSEQQNLDFHERGGTASPVELDSFRSRIKYVDNQIIYLEQQLERLKGENGGIP